MICQIPGCQKEVAAITTKDGRRSKMFCVEHAVAKFELPCPQCGTPVSLKASSYLKRLNSTDWSCARCHRLNNAAKYRGSEAQKKHLDELYKSGAVKAYYDNPANKEAIHQKMLKHNRSPKMRESSSRLAKKVFRSIQGI